MGISAIYFPTATSLRELKLVFCNLETTFLSFSDEGLNVEKGSESFDWGRVEEEIEEPEENNTSEEIDCSLYSFRGTDIVYVNHLTREILHVDMSD